MIDHIGFRVRDLEASRRFYDACANALGIAIIDNTETSFLIGESAAAPLPFVWVGTTAPAFWTSSHATSASPIHLAFKAGDREAADDFHGAALAAGGTDNGAPGPRGPSEIGYYAAFVLDPDGNNVEAGFRS